MQATHSGGLGDPNLRTCMRLFTLEPGRLPIESAYHLQGIRAMIVSTHSTIWSSYYFTSFMIVRARCRLAGSTYVPQAA